MSEDKSNHALACVLYGDCIYDVVQEGTKALEKKWAVRARPWYTLTKKAVKTGIFGWGSPLVDERWLLKALFQGKRFWPAGLSQDEKKILELAKASSAYHRLYAQGVNIDRSKGVHLDPVKEETEAQGLAALKKYADLFTKKVAIPMWEDYEQISAEYGRKIQPLCEEKYGEECTKKDSQIIFRGDMQRGLAAKTLDVDPPTYTVLRSFLKWVAA